MESPRNNYNINSDPNLIDSNHLNSNSNSRFSIIGGDSDSEGNSLLNSNRALIETFGNYIVKIAEYFRDFEMIREEEKTGGLGVNGVRELTWDTANMEQHLKNRVSQFAGSHLSKIRLGIPEKVKELIDNGRDYAREHPVTFVTLIALLLSCSVPVLAFLFFAISTVAVTFLGFLFVEGTILTVASVALTTTLLLVAFTTLTLTSLFMLAYVTLNASIKLVTGSPIGQSNPINAFMQFLSPSSEPTFSSAGSTTGSEEDEDDLEGHSDVDIQELSGCEDDEEEEENPRISLTNNKLCTPDHDSDVDAQLEDLLH